MGYKREEFLPVYAVYIGDSNDSSDDFCTYTTTDKSDAEKKLYETVIQIAIVSGGTIKRNEYDENRYEISLAEKYVYIRERSVLII